MRTLFGSFIGFDNAAYQRVPHLDDGLPGDWRALTTRAHDELAAGVSYHPVDALLFGVAARGRTQAAEPSHQRG